MAGNQRVYKQRIRSTQTLQKVFRAMELIASSRIGAARRSAAEAGPYDHALSQAVAAVGTYSGLDHPITREREDTNRVAVLVVTSDRGMAGAYSATILRESERLIEHLMEDGKEPILFTYGRRAQNYFAFRGRTVEYSWTGDSDRPSAEHIEEVASLLLEYFLASADAGGVAEVHIVFTRYVSMVSQVPEVRRMLPLTVVDLGGPGEINREDIAATQAVQLSAIKGTQPLYEFVPSTSKVLDALLTRYVGSRIRNALLQSAASELASRQQAMHTATDNAEELITTYTRLANSARQADITQEISEIVSGADSLAAE
ncbi:F0F1 ATP synthase subunit gamma [Actinomyces gaoshouyii]|uniref:ATP synthase gamma chain n=1 Tax=Actinomyces gaoshouyii TaxID=1960083 RepID=A0A8H9HDB4_9ACTO|nr:F0F1 ATP synthase subunit gamma [Actinomyces gaoshouyii]ARD42067.1 F0F1 ATP synthase subunit gamma [Actinomyces gaoshouyii]GGO96701.1 ATP synthase gamma chain [Actinomyces gaoshouyii]